MEIDMFLKKYKNEVFSESILNEIYNTCDFYNDENLADFEFLFPIIKELYYYKTQYAKIITNNYHNNKEILKSTMKESDYFIYDLLDKGVEIDDIIKFQIKAMKRIVIKTLEGVLNSEKQSYKIVSDLKEKILGLVTEDISIDEMEIEAFRTTYALSEKFEMLCRMLDL